MSSESFSLEMIETMTPREREIFGLFMEGLKAKDVAKKLGISESGVNFFTKRIYKKLHVNSKPELILRYYECRKKFSV